uniref:U3 small nucleolar RNA-associated protein 14 homolog A-like n=1 Tax=Styela clava TaxID=7725 RepID=UPI00193A446C|nr:U3 small nucleolar RNA-associated protein 14 homolog A-like [Styela clava]
MDSLDALEKFESNEKEREFTDEENDSGDEAERHNNLLNSLGIESKSDEKKLKNEQRSEATNDVSIYSLNAGSKVKAHDLIKSLKETVNVNLLKKGLSKVENSNTQLAPLLPKVAADRVERDAAYDQTSEKVSRWDNIVKRNRNSEQLSFPLKHENLHLNTVDDFVQKFKPKTPLEQQIYALLKGNKYEERSENGLSVAEEKALKSIGIQEARRRRAELQKHRALLSYHEAKNRRLGKIKSRRHLRIIRKQKEKKSVTEFEELQRKDPEKAAEKLKYAEKTRAEERAVLRHRQGSKWAKNRMLMAKYDEMTKVQLGDQRKLHSELVQKNLTKIEDSDEEGEENEKNNDLSTLVSPTASMQTIYLPKDNPWLRQGKAEKLNDENNNDEGSKGAEDLSPRNRLYTKSKSAILGLEKVTKQKQESDNDSSENEEEELKEELKEIKSRKKLKKMLKEDSDEEDSNMEQDNKVIQEESIKNFKAALKNLRKADEKTTKESEDEEESEEHMGEPEGLDITTDRRKTLQDLEQVLRNENKIETLSELHKAKSLSKTDKKGKNHPKLDYIDPNKVFTIPTENIFSEEPTLVQNHDEEGDSPVGEDKNRMTIQEAFADDDVMAEFISEKRKMVADSRPKVEDSTLPGWGEWGGVGLKPSKRRRKKFFIKPCPPPPRKDQHLGPVIINEKRNVYIAKHQINQIPHPFTSDEQYERSIRQPLGKTWNTASTFRKLTEPKVKTVMGAIINPMDEDDAFDDTKPQQRKRVMHDDGNIGFDDVVDTSVKKRRQRRKGNKKHKK